MTNLSSPAFPVVNRNKFLKRIEEGFKQRAEAGLKPILVIYGMGGVGKSELVNSYGRYIAEKFEFVRWINADSLRFLSDFESFGFDLGLSLDAMDKSKKIELVKKSLRLKKSWLIILDNTETLEPLCWLPENQTHKQQVLITSRSANWPGFMLISLGPFTKSEAKEYIENRLEQKQLVGEKSLVKQLEYLPLALSHAVAYIKQSKLNNAREYLKRYEEIGVKLFESKLQTEAKFLGYEKTILTTWQLSIDKLETSNPCAVKLLKFCGYLHPSDIQKVWLQKALNVNETAFDECIRDIGNYSLLIEVEKTKGFKIHRLVQHSIVSYDKEILKPDILNDRLQLLIDALCQTYPLGDISEIWKWQPHLKALFNHWDNTAFGTDNILLRRLLLKLSRCYTDTHCFLDAIEIYEKLFDLISKINKPKQSLEMMIYDNNLAGVYINLQEKIKAKPYVEGLKKFIKEKEEKIKLEKEVDLAIVNKGYSPSGVNILGILYSTIGSFYMTFWSNKNYFEQAVKFYKKSLCFRKEELKKVGSSSGNAEAAELSVATSESNIGLLLLRWGNVNSDNAEENDTAYSYLSRALAKRRCIYEKTGRGGEDFALSLNFIAWNHLEMAHETPSSSRCLLKKANEYIGQSLKTYEHVCEEKVQRNIGYAHALITQGDIFIAEAKLMQNPVREIKKAREALSSYKKASEIFFKSQIKRDMGLALMKMGEAYHILKKNKKAQKYYDETLEKFGDIPHPYLAQLQSDLARIHPKSKEIQEKAYEIYKICFGEDHKYTTKLAAEFKENSTAQVGLFH